MSLAFYQTLHVISVLLIYSAYGMLIARALLQSDHTGVRKLGAILSGVGLLLLLVSGFGMIAKYQGVIAYTDWWVLLKIVLFLALGAMIALINRKPELGKIWLASILFIGALAAFLGLNHGSL